ncbi:right-handed parallel beta-helix repeat-containing protein [Ureibacillus sp. FSL K6-8385]|uniref:right-handed parallel beta-helix repeat-containing protein n=1 Tax=Ureibacillus sp. FSL K6-8385 TaxID=2954684 RepID=UPI0031593960
MIRSIYNLMFSKFKTLKSTLTKTADGEIIQLFPKKYKESVQIDKDVTLVGDPSGQTVVEGMLIIPRNVRVIFRQITLSPNAQLYIEGEAIFERCIIKGNTDVLITVNGGYIKAVESEFKKAGEVGIALLNNSNGIFKGCKFRFNGDTHLFIKQSKAYLESCEGSNALKSLWITDGSFVQTKKCHFHHHIDTQILAEGATYIDDGSTIESGDGLGIAAKADSEVTLHSTILYSNASVQLFIENSRVSGKYCTIQNGKECGVMLHESEGFFAHCEISNHQSTNVQAKKKSIAHFERCEIHSGHENGIFIGKDSIVNCSETIIKNHLSFQVVVSEKSICSMKDCFIVSGRHVGILVEKKSECMLVECYVLQNNNSAFNVDRAILKLYRCEVSDNNGNGILAINHSHVEVDGCNFHHNQMPHIASKTKVKIYICNTDFHRGKSIFLIQRCKMHAVNSRFHDSMNVQIEITEHSTAKFEHCQIYNGKSYGVKVLKNSNFFFYHSQIFKHDLSQIVVNDSSVILNNSEIYQGKRNALFIQNHSEVYIQESFISKHAQTQIWIDNDSTLELLSVQLTDGEHSDLHAQNQSRIYVENSMIRNEKCRYNVQALNHSKIEIVKTIVENKYGDVYYSENNSSINNSDY